MDITSYFFSKKSDNSDYFYVFIYKIFLNIVINGSKAVANLVSANNESNDQILDKSLREFKEVISRL
jgi:hypothetical protein